MCADALIYYDISAHVCGYTCSRKIIHEQRPVFSTWRVHEDYVDCVQWIGDMLLSKSTRNKVPVNLVPNPQITRTSTLNSSSTGVFVASLSHAQE